MCKEWRDMGYVQVNKWHYFHHGHCGPMGLILSCTVLCSISFTHKMCSPLLIPLSASMHFSLLLYFYLLFSFLVSMLSLPILSPSFWIIFSSPDSLSLSSPHASSVFFYHLPCLIMPVSNNHLYQSLYLQFHFSFTICPHIAVSMLLSTLSTSPFTVCLYFSIFQSNFLYFPANEKYWGKNKRGMEEQGKCLICHSSHS